MRKLIAIMIVATVTGTAAFAQDWYNSYAPGIDQNILINAGIGFGPTGDYKNGVIPLSVSADFKLPIDIPLTVGGIFTYSQWKLTISIPTNIWGTSYENYDLRWNNFGLGVRVMYHFNFVKNFDVYTGITLGYVIQTLDASYYDDIATVTGSYDAQSFFLFGVNVGARYFFTEYIGAYLEVGWSGLQFASLGVTFKL
jgi:opacity protein-like surface antigen